MDKKPLSPEEFLKQTSQAARGANKSNFERIKGFLGLGKKETEEEKKKRELQKRMQEERDKVYKND